ncbi:hypothetical protein M011DRAFT_411578 [Sporormia fimetaria CBS 119925]|uniref:Protein PBN1 n=1 Tax=Sporormia fimetaria CBS 119925 TaxID=1340428 RepID=A0A6A6V127_9PLEO|nr:hypothetical protein M011DRAFT_411578 [Sporormia fimetaria CBS 119925]
MRAIPVLCCLVTCAGTVTANVEKTIFTAPASGDVSSSSIDLVHFRLDALSSAHSFIPSARRTRLPVQFPSPQAPRGLESWYVLQDLEEGRRYEVRICWPATSPTDFWLDTFPVEDIVRTPDLHFALSEFSHTQKEQLPSRRIPAGALLLRVQAAASFYTTNQTLMSHPEDVPADIILDPYLFNILPQSLGPFAIYLTIVSIGAWFLSGAVYRCILSVATSPSSKPHNE